MTQKQKNIAIQNAVAREPIKYELGGDIYYTCHWIKCNEQLKRWWTYCPNCGQKIDWGEDE